MSDELTGMLDEARSIANIPFRINSGTRCASRNKQEGGLPSSAHLKGLAVDIRCPDSETRSKILTALLMVGFDRIGIAKSFIHVDIDTTKPTDVVWLYR